MIFLAFYFEIIIASREVAKIVERPHALFTQFLPEHLASLYATSKLGNQRWPHPQTLFCFVRFTCTYSMFGKQNYTAVGSPTTIQNT